MHRKALQMRKYHQLTAQEREKIAMLRQSKHSLAKIALALNRSKATISRELKRKSGFEGIVDVVCADQEMAYKPLKARIFIGDSMIFFSKLSTQNLHLHR